MDETDIQNERTAVEALLRIAAEAQAVETAEPCGIDDLNDLHFANCEVNARYSVRTG